MGLYTNRTVYTRMREEGVRFFFLASISLICERIVGVPRGLYIHIFFSSSKTLALTAKVRKKNREQNGVKPQNNKPYVTFFFLLCFNMFARARARLCVCNVVPCAKD